MFRNVNSLRAQASKPGSLDPVWWTDVKKRRVGWSFKKTQGVFGSGPGNPHACAPTLDPGRFRLEWIYRPHLDPTLLCEDSLFCSGIVDCLQIPVFPLTQSSVVIGHLTFRVFLLPLEIEEHYVSLYIHLNVRHVDCNWSDVHRINSISS